VIPVAIADASVVVFVKSYVLRYPLTSIVSRICAVRVVVVVRLAVVVDDPVTLTTPASSPSAYVLPSVAFPVNVMKIHSLLPAGTFDSETLAAYVLPVGGVIVVVPVTGTDPA